MFYEITFVDIVQKLFTGLYACGQVLYDFISKPLGTTIVNAPIIKDLFNFKIIAWRPFEWIADVIERFLPFSIIEAIPAFILIGLIFVIVKHLLPI